MIHGVRAFLRDQNSCLTGSLQQTATVKMEEADKKRSPNFSPQNCLLLTEIMGEIHPDFTDMKLSFHKVDKYRFNSRITSSTKKAVWRTVAEKFKSSASLPREAAVLQKKWDNLVAKHRNLYRNFKRAVSLTGRGPTGFSLSVLTEAIMNVIGKESLSVVGAGGDAFDTTINVLLEIVGISGPGVSNTSNTASSSNHLKRFSQKRLSTRNQAKRSKNEILMDYQIAYFKGMVERQDLENELVEV